MIGWRRRAKAQRESTVSAERLYELVNQTLMENFGPLGSFAITRRKVSDTDDIFHTALARSVARDIVANLAEHGITVRENLGQAAPAVASVSPASIPSASMGRSSVAPLPQRASLAPVAARAELAPVERFASPLGKPFAPRPAAVASDPLEDEALRSLVAHHREVAEASAKKAAEADWTVAN